MQVHQMQRGLAYALTENEDGVDASALLFRYRIEWRAKLGGYAFIGLSDLVLWEWGVVGGEGEKGVVKRAFVGPLGRFVAGEGNFGWGTSGARGVRTLREDGRVEIVEDGDWEEGVRVWKVLRDADRRYLPR
ncbi:hypothetical protein HAV15_006389 [Penicillium sp. str. |nr:hypothetical protein HAV15_006389 [Penicillium sp. str. \